MPLEAVMPGQQIGRYEFLEQTDESGFGVVWAGSATWPARR